MLVEVGSPARAARINQALLARGVIVRPTGAFGAPDAVRITIGRPDENAELLSTMAAVLDEVGPD